MKRHQVLLQSSSLPSACHAGIRIEEPRAGQASTCREGFLPHLSHEPSGLLALGGENNGGLQPHLGVCVGVGPRQRSRAGSGCSNLFPLLSSQGLAAMAFPRVRLVVTADDFGYCPRRDEGIVEAFLAGTVTSVSLLVNGTAAESAAELARR